MKYTKEVIQEILEEKYPNKNLLLVSILEDLDIIAPYGGADGSYYKVIDSKYTEMAILEDREILITEEGLKYIINYLEAEINLKKDNDENIPDLI